jgi:hypothetical protein
MSTPAISPSLGDLLLVKLAREIAMDIHPLETILKQYSISGEGWERLQKNPRFIALLGSEVEAWNTALNTAERVKLKAASMMEEFLPELNNRLHDGQEALPAKIEGAKLVAKMAGIGEKASFEGGSGEKFTVTINLGAGAAPITIAKDVTPAVQTIEHEPA